MTRNEANINGQYYFRKSTQSYDFRSLCTPFVFQ